MPDDQKSDPSTPEPHFKNHLHEDFLNHPNPHERRAAHMLLAIEHQNAMDQALKNPIPEQQSETRSRINDIRKSLDLSPETSEIKRLEQQAEILDKAFRRLMLDADITYENLDRCDCDPMKYAAAFKAQDQYRRTIKTLKLLKQKGKIRKIRGKRR